MVFRKKPIWPGMIPHRDLRNLWTVHQTFFVECQRNCGRSSTWPILNILIHSGDIRRLSSKSTEIGPNLSCFWLQKFLGGEHPKSLNRHYKTWPSTDHRAKFHADRPTDLKDLALKKNLMLFMLQNINNT